MAALWMNRKMPPTADELREKENEIARLKAKTEAMKQLIEKHFLHDLYSSNILDIAHYYKESRAWKGHPHLTARGALLYRD